MQIELTPEEFDLVIKALRTAQSGHEARAQVFKADRLGVLLEQLTGTPYQPPVRQRGQRRGGLHKALPWETLAE